jgi:hypothetical protein
MRPAPNQVLCPQNNWEKPSRSQGDGEGRIVPELLFEQKGLIPALQHLIVFYRESR